VLCQNDLARGTGGLTSRCPVESAPIRVVVPSVPVRVQRMNSVIAALTRHKLQALWIGLVAAALVGMYWEVGRVFVGRWFEASAYYHCLAVPAIAGWFLWRRWERLTSVDDRPSGRGFILLALGLLLYWASARTGVRMVAGLAFPIILAGIVGTVCGSRTLKIAAVPIGLLIFAVPFPEHAIGMVAMPMQQVSAVIAGKLAPLIGLQVAQQGINLDLHGFNFVVAQECSGMHSLVALLLTGFVLVELSDLDRYRKVAAIVVIPPLVLFANVVRLIVVLLLGEYLGPELALGAMVHGFSDVIVYFAAVLSFVLFIGWLYETQRNSVSELPTSAASADEVELEGVTASGEDAQRSDSTTHAHEDDGIQNGSLEAALAAKPGPAKGHAVRYK